MCIGKEVSRGLCGSFTSTKRVYDKESMNFEAFCLGAVLKSSLHSPLQPLGVRLKDWQPCHLGLLLCARSDMNAPWVVVMNRRIGIKLGLMECLDF